MEIRDLGRVGEGAGFLMWFEIAIVMTILAVGNIFFGHFEERTPTWRRLLKIPVIVGLVVAMSATLGRAWEWRVWTQSDDICTPGNTVR